MPQVNRKEPAKPMRLEDLAALIDVNEDSVLDELQNRHVDGLSYTFAGDVLLYVNTNQNEGFYEKKVKFVVISIVICTFLSSSAQYR